MRWFIAATVVCAVVIWVQIELINKSAPVPAVPEPKAAETPLTAPKETAIVPPSQAPAAPPPKQVAQGAPEQPASVTMSSVAVSPEQEVPAEKLVSAIQTELQRLGCYSGETAGSEWDRTTRRALRRFARHAGVEINDNEPAASMLAMLRGYETNKECKAVALRTQPGARTPANTANGSDTPGKDDAYLPPWMRAKDQAGANTGQPAATPGGDTLTGGGGQDAPVADNAAKPQEKKRRRYRSSNPFDTIGRALGID